MKFQRLTIRQVLDKLNNGDGCVLELHTVYYLDYKRRVEQYFGVCMADYYFGSNRFREAIEGFLERAIHDCSRQDHAKDFLIVLFRWETSTWIAELNLQRERT